MKNEYNIYKNYDTIKDEKKKLDYFEIQKININRY